MATVDEQLAELRGQVSGLSVTVGAMSQTIPPPSTGEEGRITKDLLESLGSGMSYDYVYPAGKRVTVPARTTKFLKVYLDGTTAPEWVAAMPAQQDTTSEVVDVTKNRIHFPGAFGRD